MGEGAGCASSTLLACCLLAVAAHIRAQQLPEPSEARCIVR